MKNEREHLVSTNNENEDLPHSVYLFERHDEMRAKNEVVQEVQWDQKILL